MQHKLILVEFSEHLEDKWRYELTLTPLQSALNLLIFVNVPYS